MPIVDATRFTRAIGDCRRLVPAEPLFLVLADLVPAFLAPAVLVPPPFRLLVLPVLPERELLLLPPDAPARLLAPELPRLLAVVLPALPLPFRAALALFLMAGPLRADALDVFCAVPRVVVELFRVAPPALFRDAAPAPA